jgi:hypothetical protein
MNLSYSVFMKHSIILFACLTIIALTASCRHKETKQEVFTPVFSTFEPGLTNEQITEKKREIFYGLLTPIEICNLFDRLNIPYEEAILNPISNSDQYLSSSKASINLGVYGVDLGYLKTFNLQQEIFNYMLTIRSISNKLGIPENYLTDPIKSIEKDSGNSDSLIIIMNKAYKQIEDNLQQNGQESTAGLMLMGGWVEAMYIATQLLYDDANPDPEVVERIAEQKYTLVSLLSYMKNYYDDPIVVYYTKKLLYLKKYFDTFEIYFRKGDLEIDNIKQVLRSSGSEMTVTVETLNQIRDYVLKLRSEMTGL